MVFVSQRHKSYNSLDVKGVQGYKQLFKEIYKFKPDVVIGTSPPLPINIACYFAARLRGARFVLDVKDPAIYLGEELGSLKKGSFKHRLYVFLERFLHRHADKLLVSTEADFEEIGQKFSVPEHKLVWCRNGVSKAFIEVAEKTRVPVKELEILYSGTMGNYELPQFIEEVYSKLKVKPRLHLILNFDGSKGNIQEREKIYAMLKKHGLCKIDNVTVEFSIPYEELPKHYPSNAIAVLPLPNFFKTTIPAKIYDYAACELPIVAKARLME